ncbi:MAG: hypothetical protein IJI16_02600 [Atopobiaceae bacterium]|nr:hypothetical protein [Atopobiaceae bacterium]MBQ6410822.1 hypothetical protein [Atopobiaceae bacterium]
MSFENKRILVACQRAKVDYLVTWDQSLISHANVVAKTPEAMLDLADLGC